LPGSIRPGVKHLGAQPGIFAARAELGLAAATARRQTSSAVATAPLRRRDRDPPREVDLRDTRLLDPPLLPACQRTAWQPLPASRDSRPREGGSGRALPEPCPRSTQWNVLALCRGYWIVTIAVDDVAPLGPSFELP
jgi:hypothetical protein